MMAAAFVGVERAAWVRASRYASEGGASKNFFDELPRRGLSVQLETFNSLVGERKGDFWVYEDRMIHEYEGSDAFSPELVRADESFLHAQRPADDGGGFATQVLEQFANVAPAPRRMVSLRRLL